MPLVPVVSASRASVARTHHYGEKHMSLRILFLSAIAAFGLIGIQSHANAALKTDPFAYDPSFNGGNAIEDRFAALSTDRKFVAWKAVRLANGDVVVAGLVPPGFQADQPNGYFNLGLVRYSASGGRVPWPNATPMYDYYSQHTYIAYPNNSNLGRFTAVRDIKSLNGFLYVLVDYEPSAIAADVHLVVFSEDGRFVEETGTFTSGLNEYGAGLATYSYNTVRPGGGFVTVSKIIAVATYLTGGGRGIITVKRFSVATDGSTTLDNAFGPSGTGVKDYVPPNSFCAASPCSIRAAAVAVTQGIGLLGDHPRVYIGAQSLWQDNDWDPVVLAIDGSSGDALSFGSNGFLISAWDIGGDNAELTADIAATGQATDSDEIYLLSRVSMDCRPGIGLLKLNSHGLLVSSFGHLGMTLFGGSNDSNCTSAAVNTLPAAMVLQGDRIAIVGTEGYISPTIGNQYRPLLAIVDRQNGAVRESRAMLPAHVPGATFTNGSGWNDVVADDQGRFIATGPLYDSLGSKPLFGTARYAPDRIFGDDFEQP